MGFHIIHKPAANTAFLRRFAAFPSLDNAAVRWQKAPRSNRFQARRQMNNFLLKLFTWWNSQTVGTQFWTWMYGEAVGEDEFGNRYYRTRGGQIDKTLGFERRWVIYNGYTEASMVPPSWHGWLHHTVDTPPTQENYKPRSWQKPHRPNMTGTPGALRPPGSTLAAGRRPKATGDYKAWNPGNQ
jgi:NADH:ubiquinone oxidoreductase subunit